MSRTLKQPLQDELLVENRGCALIVSNSNETIEFTEKNLQKLGFSTLVSKNGEQAFNLFKSEQISHVLIDIELEDVASHKLVHTIRVYISDNYDAAADRHVPIIILADNENEEQLLSCVFAGSDDVLLKPFNTIALNFRIASLEKMCELKQLYKSSLNEQILAKQILNNALDERSIPFKEIELLSKSASIFSGDLFLTARCLNGNLNVLIADFTGHGLSAAIGALPVADVFNAMTKKGFELDSIIENINNKLHTLLPAGMFMACSVLTISSDLKNINVWNGGIPDIYVREHETGHIKHKIKSSHIPLGITEVLINKVDLKITTIDLKPGDQLILYTDGLTEAMNANGDMFGEERLDKCLQKHCKDNNIFSAIVDTFNEFCGNGSPNDDITLACISCTSSIMHKNVVEPSANTYFSSIHHDDWFWHMELRGADLREINPVPVVINEIIKFSGHSVVTESLSSIMSKLYENVIEYSAPEEYLYEVCPDENNHNTIKDVNDIYLQIGLKRIEHNGKTALLVRMEDSGKEVTLNQLKGCLNSTILNENHALVYMFHETPAYAGMGNRFEAILTEHI